MIEGACLSCGRTMADYGLCKPCTTQANRAREISRQRTLVGLERRCPQCGSMFPEHLCSRR